MKAHVLTLAGAFTVAILAGCNAGDGNGNAEAVPEMDYTRIAAEIVFYSNNGDSVESFDYRMGDSIRKKFPNYTIKYIQRIGAGTELTDLITTGTRFDIFFQSIGNFEAQAFPVSIEYDMTDLIKQHGIDLSRLDPSVVNAVKQASGGKLYGLPIFANNLVLYYNKDLFDKFGVAYPRDGMSWDEMMEINRRLTRLDNGVQYFGFTHSPSHSMRMNPYAIPSADLKTDTATINKDERWKKFYDAFYMQPSSAPGYKDAVIKAGRIPNINQFVKDKTVGMFAYLSSLIYVWEKELQEVNWDIVSLPDFKDQTGIGSQSYPSYFGITKMAENKDAAAQVLKYLVSDEFQAEQARKGIMPVLTDPLVTAELGKQSPYKDRNWKAVFYNKFAPIPEKAPYDADLIAIYTGIGTQISLGQVDLNTALRKGEEDAIKKINAFKSK